MPSASLPPPREANLGFPGELAQITPTEAFSII